MSTRIRHLALCSTLVAVTVLVGCGGDSTATRPLDLGGGIFMAADGTILGATPLALAEPDFLSASAEDWKSVGPQKLAVQPAALP